MRNLLYGLTLLIAPLAALDQSGMERNLSLAWKIVEAENSISGSELAIQLCTNWINDPAICDAEKIHYLVMRSTLHCGKKKFQQYYLDIQIIKELCRKSDECAWEFRQYD